MPDSLFTPEELGVDQKSSQSFDFTLFNQKGKVLRSGEHAFVVLAKDLIEISSKLKLVGGKSIQIQVFVNQIKISAFNISAFIEGFLPITQVTPFDAPYYFIVEFQTFIKFCSLLGEEESPMFFYVPEKNMLRINLEDEVLEFNTLKFGDFVDYHVKLQDPQFSGEIERNILIQGFEHISKFVEKNEIDLKFNMAELRDGMVLGGNCLFAGIFQQDSLKGLSLKVKQELLSLVQKVWASFKLSKISLFESSSFYLFVEDNIFFGIEKFKFSFPEFSKFLSVSSGEKSFVLNKESLLNSLYRIDLLSAKGDILQVKLIIRENVGQVFLSAQDSTGKNAKKTLPIESHSLGVCEQKFQVNLKGLIKILESVTSERVEFFEIPGKALAIMDQFDGNTTISVLAFVNQTKLNIPNIPGENSQNSLAVFVKQHILKK